MVYLDQLHGVNSKPRQCVGIVDLVGCQSHDCQHGLQDILQMKISLSHTSIRGVALQCYATDLHPFQSRLMHL